MRETEAALQELPPKKDVALFLLQRSSVFVHLDPRSDDVIVPAGFKREPRLVLQVGHNMAVPIPDLTVSEDGWSGTLSFRRVPFRCVVPWTSVFAMVGQDGQGVVWPEDVPPELAQPGGAQPGAPAPPPKIGLVPAPAPEPAAAKTTDDELAAADTVEDAKKPKTKAKRTRKKADKADKTDKTEVVAEAAASATPTPTPTPRATPTPAAARAATPVATPNAAPAAEPSSPAAAGGPAPTFGGKGAKPKRELPPYLRVIK